MLICLTGTVALGLKGIGMRSPEVQPRTTPNRPVATERITERLTANSAVLPQPLFQTGAYILSGVALGPKGVGMRSPEVQPDIES